MLKINALHIYLKHYENTSERLSAMGVESNNRKSFGTGLRYSRRFSPTFELFLLHNLPQLCVLYKILNELMFSV